MPLQPPAVKLLLWFRLSPPLASVPPWQGSLQASLGAAHKQHFWEKHVIGAGEHRALGGDAKLF